MTISTTAAEVFPWTTEFLWIAGIILCAGFLLFVLIGLWAKRWFRFIPIITIFTSGIFVNFVNIKLSSPSSGTLSSIVTSIVSSGQLFLLLKRDIVSVETIANSVPEPVSVFLGVLAILAPLCTFAVILSLISNLRTQLRLAISKSRTLYIFSELNEKTATLAESMYNSHLNELNCLKKICYRFGIGVGSYIFCNSPLPSISSNPYYDGIRKGEGVKRIGAIYINKPIDTIKPAWSLFGSTSYFIFSENGPGNVDSALRIMNRYIEKSDEKKKKDECDNSGGEDTDGLRDALLSDNRADSSLLAMLEKAALSNFKEKNGKSQKKYISHRKDIRIYITSNEIDAEEILDHKITELKTSKKFVCVYHINEKELMTYELLKQMSTSEKQNTTADGRLLLIGGGYVGLEILKSMLWYNASNKYSFSVDVIDKDILHSKKLFNHFCPAFMNPEKYCVCLPPKNVPKFLDRDGNNISEPNINLNQVGVDITTDSLHHFMKTKFESCKERELLYNYIIIATDNDEANISAVYTLRTFYRRVNNNATIYVLIRDKERYKQLKDVNKDKNVNKDKRDSKVVVVPFGCYHELYSYEKIIVNSLEKTAMLIDNIYNSTYDDNTHDVPDNNSNNENNDIELLKQKWVRIPLQKRRASRALALYIPHIHNLIKNKTFSSDEPEVLAAQEHMRWNVFTLTDGFLPHGDRGCRIDDNCRDREKAVSKLMELYNWCKKNQRCGANSYISKVVNEVDGKHVLSPVGRYLLDKVGITDTLRDDSLMYHYCIKDWEELGKLDVGLGSIYQAYDRAYAKYILKLYENEEI